MTLRTRLIEWDDKSVEDIENIYHRFSKKDDFADEVVNILTDQSAQIGGTWLLKKYLEQSEVLNNALTRKVFRQSGALAFWEAKLHLLQSIPYLSIPIAEKETAEEFIRDCLTDKNKFVRAWAYCGFYELADQYPEYREEARQFLDAAAGEESAAVKARIRNVMKKGFMAT